MRGIRPIAIFFREDGGMILPILMALSITVASLSFYFSQMIELQKISNNRLLIDANLRAYVSSLRSLIFSQRALMKTIRFSANNNLQFCINDVEFVCDQTARSPLTLVPDTWTAPGDDVILDPAAGMGMTTKMQPCSSYPSVGCPFRYEIDWYIECPLLAASCRSPDVFLEGRLRVSDKVMGTVLNPAAYAFSLRIK